MSKSSKSLILPSLMEKLEDRVLFDAVPDGGFIIQPVDDAQSQVVQHQVDQVEQVEFSARELILIDSGVENASELLNSIISNNPDRSFEVRFLDNEQSGIAQISDILAGQNEAYSAVHILSHGDAGRVQLGNEFLDLQSLQANAGEIAAWGNHLTADADLLIYGCDLASTDQGIELTESIAAITGADVAASDDLTGSESLGGDWDLEHTTGTVETKSFAVASWAGILATATDDVDSIQADATGTSTGNVLSNDTHTGGSITEVHAYPGMVGTPFQLSYGTITMNADGSYAYDVDENHPAVIGLRIGEQLEDIVSYQVTDGGGSDTGILVVTIDGVPDELLAADDFDDVTAVTDPIATGNVITGGAGTGVDVYDRGLSQLIWENEYTNGQSVSGTSRTVDGITVDISTTDPDGAGSGSNHTVSYATNGGHSGYLRHNLNGGVSTASEVTTTFDFNVGGVPEGVHSLSFILADIDRDATNPYSWQDQFTVVGSLGGSSVAFSSLVAGTVVEPTAGTFYGTGSVPPSEAHGNVNVVFDGPVDSVTITYKYGPDINTTTSGILGAVSDLSWQPPIDVFVSEVDGVGANVGVPMVSTYGTFTIEADGTYSYVVDDTNPTVIALGTGQTLVDSIPYTLENTIAQTSSANVYITIYGNNEAPTLDLDADDSSGVSGADYGGTYVEVGAPAYLSDIDVSITDIDTPDTEMAALTIGVSGVFDGAGEILTFNGDAGASITFSLDATAPDQQITVNGLTFNVAYDGTNFTITNNAGGDMPNADVQAFISGITYENTNPAITAGDRIFDFIINDGETDSNVASSTINVVISPEAAEWSLTGDATVDEGGTASYTLSLNNALRTGETAQVDLVLGDIDTNSADYATINSALVSAVAGYAGPGSLNWDGTTLTFTSDGGGAMGDLTIDIDANNDMWIEGPEDFNLSIVAPASTSGESITVHATNNNVTTTINDTQGVGGAADGPGEWSISGPVSGDEGSTPQYIVSLSGTFGAGEVVTVDLGLTDIDTNSSDYGDLMAEVALAAAANPDVSFNSVTGTLTYTAPSDGASMTDLLIDLPLTDDGYIEGPEDYTLNLNNATTSTGANVGINVASVTTTIDDTQGDGGPADGPGEWSISGPVAGDEGSTAQYTVSLSGTFGAGEIVTVDINLSDIATNSSDYGDVLAAITAAAAANPDVMFDSVTGTLTYTAPSDGATMVDLLVDLPLSDDGYIEGAEDFSINLINAATTTGANVGINVATVTTTINDTQGAGGAADGPGEWSISGPVTIDEGLTAQYTIALSGIYGAGETVTVDIALTDIDTNSSDYGDVLAAITAAAAANPDVSFNSVSGTLTYIAAGDGAAMSSLVVDVPISTDGFTEGDEDFSLDLTNATTSTGANVAVSSTANSAMTTILDADAADWSISGPVTTDEGSTAIYTITLSGSFGNGTSVTVDVNLSDIGTSSNDYGDVLAAITAAAAANPDVTFNSVSGTLTYTAPSDGASMADLVINLSITDDGFVEGAEDFTIDLANATTSGVPVGIATSTVTTTINDTQGVGGTADGPGEWSISGPVAGDEGSTPQYIVSLSGTFGAGEVVTVDLGLTDIDTNSSDYGDLIAEIAFAAAANPDVSFNSVTGTLTYTSPSDGASMADLLIDLPLTDDGYIEGPEDYMLSLTNATTSTGANVGINIASVTTTIDDTQGDGGPADGPGEWSISGPVAGDEGSTAQYTVSLSGTFGAGEIVTVDINLSDIATNSSDYGDVLAAITAAAAANPDVMFNSVTGTLTYTAPSDGASMADLLIDLPLTDDGYIEGAEDFSINLTNAATTTGANVGINVATVTTTINDTQGVGGAADGPGEWSISGPVAGDEGSTAQYIVSLSGTFGAGEVVTVDINLSDIATNSSDYGDVLAAITAAAAANPDVMFNSVTGTLTYTAPSDGATMADLLVDLPLTDDGYIEGAEDFSINLTNAATTTGANVGINVATVTTTINDTQGVGGAADGPGEWSISGPVAGDEGSTAQYTVSLSGTFGAGEIVTVDINLSDIATNSSDYGDVLAAITAAAAANPDVMFNSVTGTLTYTAPSDGASMADLLIDLPLTDDGYIEGAEDFSINLTNAATTTGANVGINVATVTTTINDTQGVGGAADGPGEWSISGPVTGDEGATAQYIVSLSGTFGAGEVVTVDINLSDIATNSSDYGDVLAAITAAAAANPDVMFNSVTGTLTYTAPIDGATMADLIVDLPLTDDGYIEGAEDFSINLINAATTTGANVGINVATVTTTINDTQGVGGTADGPGEWSISGPVSGDEGSTPQYIVSLSGTFGAGEVVTVDLGLTDVDTNSSDYGDLIAEIALAAAANPDVSFNSVTGTLTYTAPSDGTSMADLLIDLPLTDDGYIEGPEDYMLSLTNATTSTGANVGINVASVTTTIDDTQGDGGPADGPGEWSISGPVAGDEGSTAQYTVSLSGTFGAGEIVTVDINLSDIATNSSDYGDVLAAITAAAAANPDVMFNSVTGTLTYTAPSDGATMADLLIDLPLTDDGYIEGAEDFSINLANAATTTGANVGINVATVTTTINDTQGVGGAADGPGEWSISGPVAGDEGSAAQYTVSLSGTFGAGEIVTVDINLSDIATNSSDYGDVLAAITAAAAANPDVMFNSVTGTLTYTAPSDGAAMADLIVDLPLTDDGYIEGAEDFSINLANAATTTGANVGINVASVTTIINDTQGVGGAADGPGEWSISGPVSGDEGSTPQYIVSLSGTFGAGEVVTVDLGLTDIDTNSSDYGDLIAEIALAAAANPDVSFNSVTGTLTYTAPSDGASMADLLIDLPLTDDGYIEGPEDYTLNLTNATTSTGANVGINIASVTTTIDDTQGDGGVADGPGEWSISGPVAGDEGSTVQYTVSLSGTFGAGEIVTVDINLSDIATNSSDYGDVLAAIAAAAAANPDVMFNSVTGTLTYTAPSDGASMADLLVDLPLTDEGYIEGAEDFSINLTNAATTTGANVGINVATVTTTINDTQGVGGAADGPGEWSINGATSIAEGSNATYTIALSGVYGAGEIVSVDLNLNDIDTSSSDYGDAIAAITAAAAANPDVMFNSVTGTLTYTAPSDGASMSDLLVTLPTTLDGLSEGDEDFSFVLSNAATTTGANVGVDSGASSVVTTIVDADVVNWSIGGPVTSDEGSTIQYTVSLSGSFGNGAVVSVDVDLNNLTTNSSDYGDVIAAITAAAAANPDVNFNSVTGTLTYTAPSDGATMADLLIDLSITNDNYIEGVEDFTFDLSNATSPDVSVGIATASVTTTINDTQGVGGVADGPGEWSISGPVSGDEGSTPQYIVSLSGTFGAGEIVTVDLGLTDIDTNSSDYGDLIAEIALAATANPDVSFNSVTGTLTYTSPSDGASMADLLIDLPLTDDGYIEGPEDYMLSLTNATTSTGANVGINVASVTTTIDDTQGDGGPADGPGEWSISGPVAGDEGSTAQYTVSLSGTFGAGEIVTVDINLSDIATNSSDYGDVLAAITAAAAANPDVMFNSVTGTLTYTAPSDGASMADLLIDLPLTDDGYIEGAEDFSINLTNAATTTGANVGINVATVTTTINDTQGVGGAADGPGEWSISGPVTGDEGATAQYIVSLSGTFGAGEVVTVDINLSDIATNSSDYGDVLAAITAAAAANPDVMFNSVTGTLTYTAPSDGAAMADLIVDLPLTDDGYIEGAEDFSINLINAATTTGANVGINVASVTTTINDTQGVGGAADGPGEWSISGPVSGDEGSTPQYIVSLSGTFGAGEVVTVDLGLTDVDTNSSDYGDLIAEIALAVAANPDVSFNSVTGTLTYTAPSDGASMADLLIDLPLTDDGYIEGPEDYTLNLTNATTSTGANVGINIASVTTTIDDTQGDGGVADGPGEWSISGPVAGDEGSTVQYTVSLSGTFGAGEIVTVDINLSDIATNSSDYGDVLAAITAAVAANPDVMFNSVTGTLTYMAPSDGATMADLLIDLPLTDDGYIEGAEDFSINLTNAATTTGANVGINVATVTTTINDTQGVGGAADGPGEWSISGPVTGDEGATAQYTVSLSGTFGAGEIVTVDINLSDIATNNSDYGDVLAAITAAAAANPDVMFNSVTGTLTYTAPSDGATMADLLIDLPLTDEGYIEGAEDFSINLTNAATTTGANVGINVATVTTTINDTQGVGGAADGPGEWSISGPVAGDEGATAQYTVSLSGTFGAGEIVTVDINLSDIATNSSDYGDVLAAITAAAAANPDVMFNSVTGTLTYTAPSDGAAMADLIVDLPLTDDGYIEGAEDFSINLANAATTTGANVGINVATVTTTINDTQGVGGAADGPGEWSISGPVSGDEGSTPQYIVSLSGTFGAGEVVTVDLGLTDVDTNSSDYGDLIAEIALAAAANPDVSFNSVTGTLTYTAPSDGTSMADLLIDLPLTDDGYIEGPEDYTLNLTNATTSTGANVGINIASVTTTIDDTQGDGGVADGPGEWSISGPVAGDEGSTAQYTVSLSGTFGAGEIVTVDINLSDIATNSSDYGDVLAAINAAAAANPDVMFNSVTGTLTYTAPSDGATMADLLVDLPLTDDGFIEGAEDFSINLINAATTTGANVGINVATVTTTINDTQGVGGAADGPGEWSISGPVTGDEGATAQYTVSLSGTFGAGEIVTVDINLSDIATNSSDYGDVLAAITAAAAANPDVMFNSVTGTLTYTAPSDGATMADLLIDLPLTDDGYIEGAEDFSINLTNAGTTTGANVGINVASVTTTIDDTQGVGGAADGPGEWSISGPVSGDEGSTAQYTVSLGGTFGAGEIVSVDINLSDIATNSSDYGDVLAAITAAAAANPDVMFNSVTGTLTYTAPSDGAAMADLIVDLPLTDDSYSEGAEDFSINLANAATTTGANVGINVATVTTTINDTQGVGGAADGPGEWSISGPVSGDEGSTPQYIVSLSGTFGAGEVVTVDLGLTDVDTNSSDYGDLMAEIALAAAANPDVSFNSVTGTLTYTSPSDGASMADLLIDLPLTDDGYIEGPEDYTLNLTNATTSTGANVGINIASATTTIDDTQGDGGVADGPGEWSIIGSTSVGEGNNATYTIALSGTFGVGEIVTTDLNLNDIDTDSADYGDFIAAINAAVASNPDVMFNSVTGTLTYTAPSDGAMMSDILVTLPVAADGLSEGSENYSLDLTNAGTLTGANVSIDGLADSVVTNIVDADSVNWTISGPVSGDEGSTLLYTVSLSGTFASGVVASVDINLNDLTTNNSDYGDVLAAITSAAAANPDVTFNSVTSTLTFTAPSDGASMADLLINLPITDDAYSEGIEDFTFDLSNASSPDVGIGIVNATVATTINDTQGVGGVADGPTEWSISGPVAGDEGSTPQYTISLSGTLGVGEVVTVDIGLSDITTNPSDYGNLISEITLAVAANPDLSFNSVTGTLTYTSPSDGSLMADLVIDLPLTDDGYIEGPEDYSLNLANATTSTGANVGINVATVTTTINDTQGDGGPTDGPGEWSISGPISSDEGSTPQYIVSLSGTFGAGEIVTVDLGLTDVDTNSSDYGDLIAEIALAAAANPDVSFNSVTGTLTYTSPSDGASMADLLIDLPLTDDGYIEGPEDYTLNLTNATTSTGANVGINVASVTTTIDDTQGDGGAADGPGEWTISGPVAGDEGSTAQYTVSLSGTFGAGEVVAVDINLSDIATNSSDYGDLLAAITAAAAANPDVMFNSVTGTLTYTAPSDGAAMADLIVDLPLTDDGYIEGAEDFSINLTNVATTTGANVGINVATVTTTISDTQGVGGAADGPGEWSISGPVAGDEGSTAQYTVSLSGSFGAGEIVTVDINLSDIATNSSDYGDVLAAITAAAAANPDVMFNSVTGTLIYTAPSDGAAMADLIVDLPLTDDGYIEGVEDFSIQLTNAATTTGANVGINVATVTTTINDTQGVGGAADGPGEWSISGPIATDEGSIAQYAISLSQTFGAGEVVSVDLGLTDIETNSSDYGDVIAAISAAAAANPDVMFNAATGTLTYTSPSDGASMANLVVDLPIVNDPFTEGPEDFALVLTNPTTSTGANVAIDTLAGSSTTTINDTQGVGGPDDSSNWSIAGSTDVEEGGFATYTISLSGIAQAGEVIAVDVGLNDIDTTSADYGNMSTAMQNAVADRSDLSFNTATGTLSYTGDGTAMEDLTFTVPALSDAMVEALEDYQVELTAAASPTGSATSVDGAAASVTTTIDTRESNTGNTPPIATDDSGRTHVDTPVSGVLISNDGDPDGDLITVNTSPVANPSSGMVTINADGTFTYVPNSGFVGTDSFTYEVTDPSGNADTATVTIHVVNDLNGADNDGPIGNDDAGIGQKNSTISGNLLSNDSDPNGDPLTITTTPVVGPINGTVVINSDGTYTYTPNDDFVGNDSFVYEVCDSGGACDQVTAYMTVFDNPPVAADDINNTTINTPVNGNVLTNDSDPNVNDTLTVTTIPVTAPANGSVVLNSDGTYTYTPNSGFTGSDSFEYEVCDEGGNCTTAIVTIEVRDTTPNNPPVANDDSASTFTDNPVSGSLTSNDSDPDGDPLTITTTPAVPPANGTVVINPDGTFTYTPNTGFNGVDSFEYEICDDSGACDTAIMTINVLPDTTPGSNDPPNANDDMGSGLPNQTINGDLLANDSDPNGDPLTIITVPVTNPSSGTVVINPDGTYAYTPNPGFIGTDTFEYEVCDDSGACSTALVTITIADTPPPNAPPIANDDTASTLEDVAVNGNLLSNDGDPDGDMITIDTTPLSGPTNGTVVINSDGTFVYTPNSGFTGTDTFEYEITDPFGNSDTAIVTISVAPDSNGPANNPPVANDDAGISQKNTLIVGDLLANDSDLNGDPLTINTTPVSGPANGTLVINADGTYSYMPNDDFVGSDSFVYEVCDDSGACDQATVVITVFDLPPVANDDFVNTIIDTPVTGNVLDNDSNPDTNDDLSVTIVPVSNPLNGSVVLSADGTYVYTPNLGYVGVDSFEYEVCDESGNCDVARVTVEVRDTVTSGNNPPIANNDSTMVLQGGTVTSSLISNDGDPDGDPITVNTTPISNPANGSVTIHPDGTYTYIPNPTFIGTDSFTYEVCDDQGACDTASVIISVMPDSNGPVNDPPVGGDDSIIAQKNDPSSGNVLANDVDPNGDPLTVNTTPVAAPSNGTLVLNSDGTFTYTPNAGFSGTDQFQYEVLDDSGASDIVTAYITVFNEPPIPFDDVYEIVGDPISGNVLDNDSDPNGDPITASVITPPLYGTLVLGSDGSFTYTPGPAYTGEDSFTYEICDDSGACASATVTLFTPFGFDSLNNSATDGFAIERIGVDHDGRRELLLSERIAELAPEPILAGYAQPGSILVGRIYDAHGALIGETTTTVNQAGNWVMSFYGVVSQTNSQIIIEHVASEEVEVGNLHSFRLTPDTYRSLQLGAHHTQSTTIGTILSDAPSTSLDIWHDQNLNPLKLL